MIRKKTKINIKIPSIHGYWYPTYDSQITVYRNELGLRCWTDDRGNGEYNIPENKKVVIDKYVNNW